MENALRRCTYMLYGLPCVLTDGPTAGQPQSAARRLKTRNTNTYMLIIIAKIQPDLDRILFRGAIFLQFSWMDEVSTHVDSYEKRIFFAALGCRGTDATLWK